MTPQQGVDLTDEELLSYISESSTMSKSVDEYEGAADEGLACKIKGCWRPHGLIMCMAVVKNFGHFSLIHNQNGELCAGVR